MSWVEILHDNGLTVTQWEEQLYTEYIGQLWWKNWMGASMNAPIQMKEKLGKGPGDTLIFGLRGRLQGGRVTGRTPSRGNEGTVPFYNDRVTVDIVKDSVLVKNIEMTNQRVTFDALKEAKSALTEEIAVRFDDELTTMLTDTSIGRVRGRYLYGRADSNWNATHATALAALDPTLDVLTTRIIDVCKRKAKIPRNAAARIRPMKIVVGKNYEEWFNLVTHDFAARDLEDQDASLKNKFLNLTPQAAENPLFTGSAFMGAWRGTLIYRCERMPLIASTLQVTHSLFFGAQMAGVAWGQRATFREEELNYQHDRGYESFEIRGMKKLVFNRDTPEDNGQINLFVPAVSD